MLSMRDCLDYCDLTDDEVALIAEFEGIPDVTAGQIFCGLVQTDEGVQLLARWFQELIRFRRFSLKPELGRETCLAAETGGGAYLVGVEDESVSRIFENVIPFLGGLLSEKTADVRRRRLGELVDFMAAQLVRPSEADTQMAQRLAARRAAVLNEFGYFTAEQLGEANRSRAANRGALADNWRKRRQVFAIQHPDKSLRERDVYPAFQFSDHQPVKAVREILAAFGERKEPWKLALWFTSNNGWLPDSARPVDLLNSHPEAVIEAARRDAAGSAA